MARRKKRFTETEYIEKLASEYESMKNDRQPYLDKAREAAKYTLPSLLKDDNGDVMVYETPNQSIGADGVNNLASRVNIWSDIVFMIFQRYFCPRRNSGKILKRIGIQTKIIC